MKTPYLLGAAALLLAGCSTITIQTDYDRSATFATYHTYSLSQAPKGMSLSPTGEAALRDTLRANLAARGISEAAPGQAANLEVVSHVFTRDETSVQQYTQWGYVSGYGGRWPYRGGSYTTWTGAPVTYMDVRSYTSGTLMLDFIDAKTQRLVFRGTGEGPVGNPHANAKHIAEAVKKIVRRYPAPPLTQ